MWLREVVLVKGLLDLLGTALMDDQPWVGVLFEDGDEFGIEFDGEQLAVFRQGIEEGAGGAAGAGAELQDQFGLGHIGYADEPLFQESRTRDNRADLFRVSKKTHKERQAIVPLSPCLLDILNVVHDSEPPWLFVFR